MNDEGKTIELLCTVIESLIIYSDMPQQRKQDLYALIDEVRNTK